MAGGNFVAAEKLCTLKQLIEFHIPIAVDARIWRLPPEITGGKFFDDLFAKIVLEVEYIVAHS